MALRSLAFALALLAPVLPAFGTALLAAQGWAVICVGDRVVAVAVKAKGGPIVKDGPDCLAALPHGPAASAPAARGRATRLPRTPAPAPLRRTPLRWRAPPGHAPPPSPRAEHRTQIEGPIR